MAKFTVFFKDKPINSSIFESGVVHIGRDDTNDLIIDSLAIAPAHAAVILGDSESTIRQLNSDFPLIINGNLQKECTLQSGHTITIGKHRIIYSDTKVFSPLPASFKEPEDECLNQAVSHPDHLPEAKFQVMGGPHIGRLIPLKKSMTRLGRNGGLIIVTRRADGYYISVLESDKHIKLNKIPLEDKTILLKNNDELLIDNISMQFFIG